MFRNYRYVGT